ncbi:DNA polymerase I [Escherichia coli]|nr:DNA polymerase I [Escherichia coli]
MVTGQRAKPAAKPQETSVADEAPEVTATVISYDNYVTILDEETLKAWIAEAGKSAGICI